MQLGIHLGKRFTANHKGKKMSQVNLFKAYLYAKMLEPSVTKKFFLRYTSNDL